MSKNYVKIWETYNKSSLLPGMEIHHIDGNHQNNNPENLVAVTIEQHLEIHKSQRDHGAVQAILIRMNRTKEQQELLRISASKHQSELWNNGSHNFQKLSLEERSEISRNAALKTVSLGVGIHAINTDPILAIQNARNAGLIAAQKRSGFLNTESKEHGSNFVKETKWWVNIEGKRKRSKECPGDGWKEGMKYES